MALWGPMGGPKWPKTQNLARPFWRGQILVDLAGLQTPPPSYAGHQRGGRQMVSWHPFRERVAKRPFARAFSTQCSALSDFFTLFWGPFWGYFGVILRLNLLSRKSPKYCSNGPLGAQWEVQNGQKLKIWPHGAVSSAFWTIFGEVKFWSKMH